MSNRKLFKKLYSSKINKNNNYQEILKNIERKNNKKFSWKSLIIPTTSLVVICISIIVINLEKGSDSLKSNTTTSNQNNTFDDYNRNESTQNNSKNEITNDSFTSDLDIKIVNINYSDLTKINDYRFIDELNIPSDLENIIYQAIYLNENSNSNNLNYNLLNNYFIYYQNLKKQREIKISFSNQNEPINNYFDKNKKMQVKIKNNEITINQNDTLYKINFTYNDINFIIETVNIEYEELLNLLKSIIK